MLKYKRLISVVATLALSISMISCNGNEEGNNNITSNEEIVVATSVAVTEILDALGVKVSGVPKTSYELPESTLGAIEVGNPMSPDLEIIKSLNPSLVVSVDTLGSDYINLFKENNIPSEFVSLESISGLKYSINTLGEIFNKDEEANDLLKKIEEREKSLKEKAEDIEEPEIMVLFAAPGSTMLATSKSYIGSLVELVGGNNIIKENNTSFVNYSKEELVNLNPDKILVMTHAMPEETKAALEKEMVSDSAWQRIEAVKENRVVYLDSNYFGMSANLKIVDGLEILFDIVHGNGEE